jgi:hypothetical protein
MARGDAMAVAMIEIKSVPAIAFAIPPPSPGVSDSGVKMK